MKKSLLLSKIFCIFVYIKLKNLKSKISKIMGRKEKSIQEFANEWFETKSEVKFKKLIDRLLPGFHKHIIDIEKCPIKRDEIINDSFSKIWDKIHQYDSEKGAFSTWAHKIVYHEALLSKRYSNKNSSLDEMMEFGVTNYKNSSDFSIQPDEYGDEKISKEIVDELYTYTIETMKNFPENGKFKKWKHALLLKELEKKRFNEIAKIMNENENTVKGWVCKARRYLKEIVKEKHNVLVDDYKKLKCVNEN